MLVKYANLVKIQQIAPDKSATQSLWKGVCGSLWKGGNLESEIRNPECEFETLFLLSFVENHFAFTIFFCISFFKVIEYYAGSLRSLLSLL